MDSNNKTPVQNGQNGEANKSEVRSDKLYLN